MVKKSFVLHEKVIDVFYNKFYIPTIKNCHLILLLLGLIVQWNVGRKEIIFHDKASKNNIKLNKYHAENSAK